MDVAVLKQQSKRPSDCCVRLFAEALQAGVALVAASCPSSSACTDDAFLLGNTAWTRAEWPRPQRNLRYCKKNQTNCWRTCHPWSWDRKCLICAEKGQHLQSHFFLSTLVNGFMGYNYCPIKFSQVKCNAPNIFTQLHNNHPSLILEQFLSLPK